MVSRVCVCVCLCVCTILKLHFLYFIASRPKRRHVAAALPTRAMVRQSLCAAAVAALLRAPLAAAHGRMTFPPSRQGGTLEVAGTNCGWHDAGTVANCECCWYTQFADIAIPGNATIPADSPLVTTGGCHDTKPGGCDWTKARPWRAPGSAPVLSPCGKETAGGADGRDLPPVALVNRTTWKAGTAVEVAFTITANHGGGYSWRLCPSSTTPLTEACFQQHPLDFAGDTSVVQYTSGKRVTIPAQRVTSGTTPAGSMWSKNPVPDEEGDFAPPLAGLVGSNWKFSIVDQVKIPADTAPGSWVLAWRWDTEDTAQSWANCADIEIAA